MDAGPRPRGSVAGPLAAVAAAVLLSFWRVADADVFWHLATGQWILAHGALPRENLFSSVFPRHPWPNPEALFQVVVALAHRAAGWEGVQALKILLVAAFALLLHARVRRRAAGAAAAVAWTVAPLAIMQVRFTERPQLFSYLFFTGVLVALERARAGRPRTLWALPPLFALWSNLHPEFLLGLLLLAGTAVGELANRRAGRAGPRLGAGRLALVAAACAAATVLNPEGYHALAFPFLHLFLGPVGTVIEYLPAPPLRYPLYYAWLAALPLLYGPRPRRDWEQILPAAGLGLLGVLYQRDIPYVLILTAPAFAAGLAAPAARGSTAAARRATAASLLAAVVALAWALGFDRLQPYRWGWGLDERRYPAAAADALLREPWRGVLYNDYTEGGYLIHRLFPRYGVFQDGRIQAYPREFMARLHARFSPADWPAILADYRVDLAVLPIVSAAGGFPPREWGLVFWDDRWCLLARRTRAHAPLLARLEYRAFRPGADLDAVRDPGALAVLAAEMARNQRERREPSALLAADLGEILLRLGRTEEARAALERTLRLAPGNTRARALLARLGDATR